MKMQVSASSAIKNIAGLVVTIIVFFVANRILILLGI